VLSLMLLAKSLRGAERISCDLASGRRRFGVPKRRIPDSTLGDFVAKLSPKTLRAHLHEQVKSEYRRKSLAPTMLPMGVIAIDGKTTATLSEAVHPDCQKHSPKGQVPHYLHRVVNATLISSAAAVCIDQMPIPAKTNDMGVFASFYADLARVYGRTSLFELVTTDAGFTSEANARIVDDDGRGYWMALKQNQPELWQEARRVLISLSQTTAPEGETHWEQDSSRGWICYQLWRTNEMAGWGKWRHLRQVVLVRVLQSPGPLHGKGVKEGPIRILEERLYVTNLVRGRLDGTQLLRLARAHWRIENNLHGTLDIQLQEDHGRWVRRGNGLAVSALLRVIAYNFMEILRTVHLRSAEARSAAWQQLRDWVRDALVWPSLADDASLDEEVDPATP
jgi:Transposase DDE domain